jgi:IS5 family transposase
MAKFDFRLQALLNVKRQLEKSVKNELGAAIRELENQKAILNEMQLVIASQENEYRKDGVRKIKQREEEEEEKRKEQEKAEDENQRILGANIDMTADDNSFDPLPVSEFIKNELKNDD